MLELISTQDNNNSKNSLGLLKTSTEWQILFRVKVIEPGGWDISSFHWSWFEEFITRDEFESRLSKSVFRYE